MKRMLTICLLTFDCLICASEDKDPKKYIQDQIHMLDSILREYEYAGANYNISFDYHVGFLNGRRLAYQDCLKEIKD